MTTRLGERGELDQLLSELLSQIWVEVLELTRLEVDALDITPEGLELRIITAIQDNLQADMPETRDELIVSITTQVVNEIQNA